MFFSLFFTIASTRFTTNDFRYSDLQVEHEGPISERGKEVVYFFEDGKGISRGLFKERWSDRDELSSIGEGTFMYSEPTESNPNTGKKPVFYMDSGDVYWTATYEQFRDATNGRPKLDTSSLDDIKKMDDSDFGGEIVIGINLGIRKELRKSMIAAIHLLNEFQNTFIFSHIETDYRHRDYHHIWFRDGASMLKNEIIETRIPDDEQGLVITYNEFDHNYRFDHSTNVLMLAHEILVGMKYYEGKTFRSSIDDACDANIELEEDSSYLPGQARNFTTCHADLLKEMMEQIKKTKE